MTKTERQVIGVQRVRLNNYIGTLNYTMRFGKTRTGVNIIEDIKKSKQISFVIILVPNSNLRLQWEAEVSHIYNTKILVYTASTALNLSDVSCDLLIVDEIHKFTGDARINLINNTIIKSTYRIGLTGTYPENTNDATDIVYKLYPIIDMISEEEAIANNWISNYIEYNYGIELPDYDKDRYSKYSTFIGSILDLFRGTEKFFKYNNYQIVKDHYGVITACRVGLSINKYILNSNKSKYIPAREIREMLAKEKGWNKNMIINSKFDEMILSNWNPNTIEENVSIFEDYVQKRNNLINNHQDKLEAVLKLVEKFKDKQIIIFNQSIEFADKLTESINANFGNIAVCYHSKISSRPLVDENGEYYRYVGGKKKGEIKVFGSKSLKDNAINGIKQGFYRVLVTVMALDEGFNAEDIEIAITTSGTMNPIQHKQRTARVKTLSTSREKETMVVNLFFRHFIINKPDGTSSFIRSRDQTKLMLRQAQSENIVHWVENIENIL